MCAVSWKGIELQVALPRTSDAGRIQEQIQQRGQFMQDVIAQAQLQSEEVKRRQVNDLEQKQKLKNDRHDKKQLNSDTEENQPKEAQSHIKIEHPYLGKRIDING